jgi:predicted regulator of Ras-like GTPase activity (Roadblock/LC7/MglB family)
MFGIKNATILTPEVNAVLQDLFGNFSIIEAAAILAENGKMLVQAARRGSNTEALHSAIATVLAPDSAAMRQIALGTLGQVVISTASRRVMVRQSGRNALVCTLTGGHGRGGAQLPNISAAATRLAELLPESLAMPQATVPAAPLPACPLSAEEQARIAMLRPYVIGALPGVTDKIYNAMEAEPQMLRFMKNGTARLRQLHTAWLESLFSGEYGPDFVRRQQDIGHAHSRAGIPAVLFTANMAYLRAIFPTALRNSLGEGVLAENAISTVLRLVDFSHDLIDSTSAGLLSRLGTARGG